MFFSSQSIGVVAFATSVAASPLSKSISARQVGQLPALGWNGWDQGRCNAANEKAALATAQTFIDLGLKDAGYTYVNIDDCWALKERDLDGVEAVEDEIQGMGLKFGLYGNSGTKTCAGYPGSQGHEKQDADLLASWGDADAPDHRPRYEKMRDALLDTGRGILYSLCNWGYDEVWTWGAEVGHMWRMSEDNWGEWEDVVRIASLASSILANGVFTPAEERTHFGIWAVTKSPIILGTDMTKLSDDEVKLITNAVRNSSDQSALSTGIVVAIVASSGNQTVTLNLSEVPGLDDLKYSWTELLTDVEGMGKTVEAKLEAHDIAVFRIDTSSSGL
ncbi:alpha-D-galactopyranosidase [Dactylonectria macrodidyma]|uniref:Alpha-galactosidase n=1 Tax=Dactylonectria macrodidyma TaxID=307937 RepID=A0A9P9JLT4_9HYPO|nr:alpha-D-galactopyranosidase [Dactylonectria macrodidyma]